MLLSKLKEYAEQQMDEEALLPPLYARTPVARIIVLDGDGRPLGPLSRIDPSTTRGKRGRDMAAPEVVRSSGIKPLLLADNGEYTFGLARDPRKQKRVDKAHAAYRDLLDRCAAATAEPSVSAVQRFYERGGADLLETDDWDYKHKVTFQVVREGSRCRPIDLPSVQQFWLSINMPEPDTTEQCLVCGEHKPVVDRLRGKIKGIRGGQSAGTSIISANSDAFESYGLKLSRVAPTCLECGEAFTRALNALIADDKTSLAVGGTTFIFWTRQKVGFDVGAFMRQPDPAQVKALLDSVRKGRSAPIENDTEFYAAALSASGGRAVVRDWIDTTVGSVAALVGQWFDLQRIADPRDEDPTGENPRPLSLFRVAVSTVRKAEDIPVTTSRALFRCALRGTHLPMDIAFQAVRRNRAEQGVTRERAALIKLVLLSQPDKRQLAKEDNYMVALDKEHPEPAYHCGRLLAVIESVQYAALGRVNATVVDRFYGAASSTPAVVFGALLRDTQPRLAKLNPAQRGGLQNRLMEVCGQIKEFPKTLSLMQQALFSLGYYHQKAHDRAMAISRASARRKQSD
jgi:CRISPR-associated protein Csd1